MNVPYRPQTPGTEITGHSSQKGIGVTLLLSKPGFKEVYTIFIVTIITKKY